MTTQDHKKIAQAIKNFKEAQVEHSQNDTFNPLEFLIDEFAYMLEKDKNFNETKFRQSIYEIK